MQKEDNRYGARRGGGQRQLRLECGAVGRLELHDDIAHARRKRRDLRQDQRRGAFI
jgi:hypothetical protein